MYYWECRCGGDGDCNCENHGEGLAGMGEFMFQDLMVEAGGMPVGGMDTGDALLAAASMNPEPYSKVAMYVMAAFAKAWNSIENIFGIGQGRHEADVIVPLQNAVGNRLAEIVSAQDRAGVTALQDFYQELNVIAFEFEKFLRDPQFTDGRASAQAHADIIPLIADIQNGIGARIQAKGGIILSPSVTQGSGSILPRLTYPAQSTFPAIPQAGTIYPNAPLPSIRQQPIETVQAGFDTTSMLVLAAVALPLLMRRR